MNFVRSKIVPFVIGIALSLEPVAAFSTRSHLLPSFRTSSSTTCKNWLGDLWEEVIEFSTYGPSERKVLKARRKQAAAEKEKNDVSNDGDISLTSFRQAKQKYGSSNSNDNRQDPSTSSSEDDESLSLQAFQSAVASKDEEDKEEIDFDGYKLRDLLVEKWGVPLDIDFQRGSGGNSVYCTIMPVAFGSSKCRHESELDYLMHLQAVVEVLQKYNNLDPFVFFIKKTSRAPKRGIESVPYLMDLDSDSLKKIL